MSQLSVTSTVSTIPPDILQDQDDDFIDEINIVNDLYFGNIEVVPPTFSESYHQEQTGHSESDSDVENDHDFSVNEVRFVDLSETQRVEKFFNDTCKCTRLYGKPCSTVVNSDNFKDYRNRCLELPKHELDLMIKVQLYHNRKTGLLTESKKHKQKDRERPRQEYFFAGHQVCRETFAFAHGIYRKTVDAIARSLDDEGISARVHGNTGKSPKHALTMTDVQNIKTFLMNYGNKYGIPLPGRLPNHRDVRTILLPSDKTKADIHEDYLNAAETMAFRRVCLSEFRTIWLQHCPQILIMKPATDLCHSCQNYVRDITNSGNATEEEKSEKLQSYQNHLDKSTLQRDYYRDKCDTAKTMYNSLSEDKKMRGQPACSLNGMQQYSFDFAQQVHYPHYAQQVGPLFFKTPRKCNCFGVCAEGAGSQIFYLLDESQMPGKGANSVTSMLHHHFQYKSFGETDVHLQMDNCSGQNKNNTVIGYGLWRTMTGRHKTVEFSLMEVGHTKFHPDWHFGLWKVKWRHVTVETLDQVAESVTKSSRNQHNIPQLVDDPQSPVVFYNWATYLKQFFKPIKNLKKYHHFRMTSETPGVVYVKLYASDVEVPLSILKEPALDFNDAGLPDIIPTKGLSAERQWYLFDEIAPYCSNTDACPKPSVPKPKADAKKIKMKKVLKC